MADESLDNGKQTKSSHSVLDPQLNPDQASPRGIQIWTVLAFIILLGVIFSLLFGILQQNGNWNQLVQSLKMGNRQDSVVLVESKDDAIIMTVERGSYQELRAVDTTSGMVEDVSRGTQHIMAPALSHRGKSLAYFVIENQMTELIIAQIGGSSDTLVSAEQFSELGKQQSMEDLHICDWSDLWWSEEDQYLAFFGCSDKSSLIIVQNSSSGDPVPLSTTRAESESSRTLVWVSDTELAYVQPDEKDLDKVWTIDVSTGQRQQIFGP